METKDYLKDIQDIKQMMSRSSQFISLSGLSGILAGVYALIGSWLAYKTIYFNISDERLYKNLTISEDGAIKLLLIGAQ